MYVVNNVYLISVLRLSQEYFNYTTVAGIMVEGNHAVSG